MLTRRELLTSGAAAGAVGLLGSGCASPGAGGGGELVNDVHSRLNPTPMREILRPSSVSELQEAVRRGAREGLPIALAGGRHGMGGQQFVRDGLLIDTRALDAVHEIDRENGQIEVGAGIQWPALIDHLVRRQIGPQPVWGIIQKQTGADRMSLGGSLAANAHGRALSLSPIAGDVEALDLVDARGELLRCGRTENPELFALAIGGYGLFGAIANVRLRLAPRRKLERVVELAETPELARQFEERVNAGYLYGDFQFSTDLEHASGLQQGVLSCYRPAENSATVTPDSEALTEQELLNLTTLAHRDRSMAYAVYTSYHRGTSGQVYWSDTHQLAPYIDDYHQILRSKLRILARGSDVIGEVYVPLDALASFVEAVRSDFILNDVELVAGTIRLIEPDRDTFLPWAKARYACVLVNVHSQPEAKARRKTEQDFQRLIDLAIRHEGSFSLAFHRFATRQQLLECYPKLPELLRLKRVYDPNELFQSEWYRHQVALLG